MFSSSFYFIQVRDDCKLFIVDNCISLIIYRVLAVYRLYS